MRIAIFTLSLILAIFSSLQNAWGARLNLGLINTQANQDADLVLSEVPRNMSDASDEISIRWTPNNISGTLRYSTSYNGEEPNGYQNVVEDPIASSPGLFRFRGRSLPVGYFYCIIDGGESGYSLVFNIIRVADSAPSMIAPITGAGRQGINTITPTLRWEAINGVPFYHVIVSDQPFEITEDEAGTRVEGANIVWQAITSETSIQYGIPDPSEYFDNDQTAPLIGSLDRGDRPRYAWVVLNNYGNQPAYTSTVTGGVAGFEIEVAPPFEEPVNISPETRAGLNSNEILFRWTEVEEAVSYFIYVSREEISQGGSRALVPAWNAQTTFSSIACPAGEILPNGRYVWKVLAASRQGRGTMSDTTSFIYDVSSGFVTITSWTTGDNVLEYVEIQVESIDGPGVLPFATDDNGYVHRQLPVGTYIFHAIKAGYNDTTSARITIEEDEERSLTLRQRPLASSIIGTTVDENGNPVGRAIVTARQVPDGEETSTETNVSGEYQIVLQPGNYIINASAPNRRPAEEFSISLPRSSTIDIDADHGPIELESYTYSISGYVRNGNGQPINSATVIAISPDGDERRFYTPEAGSFSFNAGQGVWRMNAVKPGFYLESGEIQVPINDRNLEVNFTLLPQAGIFSGQVIIDGAPANRNAEVWFVPSAGQVTTTSVNQVGAFSRGVSPGDYVAFAVREGFHTTDSLRLSVDPGETISGLRLVLEANASSISGRITDGGGAALRNANVQAGGVSIASDANGNYSLQVAAGSHTVIATKAGYVTAQRGPVSVTAGQNIQNIDIRLIDNAGTISGTIRRGNDPIYDAEVIATIQGNGTRHSTRTARNGSYSFGLAFGNYRLTVQKEGFVAVAPGYIDVQLQAGQNVNGRDFPMLTYSGRVVGNVSSPAGVVNTPSIRITQLNDPNRVYNSNGNVQGDYAIAVAPERRYIVTTTKAGYNSVSDTTGVLAIEGEIVVNQRLTPLPASIAGVVNSDGTALAGAAVRAEGQAGAFETATDRQGRFTLSLQPGQYRVTASKPGYMIGERNQQVNAGENLAGIDFALQTNFAIISGLIRDPDETGIAGASVTIIDSLNQRSRITQTDNDGAYQMDGIIPGNYYLIVTNERYRRGTLNLGALLGRQERRGVNLALTPLAARIIGQVTASGSPVASATVYATDEDGAQFSAVTDNNGRYTISNMSDGIFELLPAKAGYTGTVISDVEVAPADTVTTNLQLVLNDGRITGIVRDPDGVGLRGVRVSAIDSLGNFAASTTNAAGQFSLDNLYPPTRYRISPQLSGYTPEQDTIRNVANSAEIAIRLFPNELRLTGQVINQIGQGIGSTEMIATSQTDGSVYRATANQVGTFTFTGLAANTRYRIQTQRNEEYYANADTTVVLAVNHLDIGARVRIIERRASVRGRITANNTGVGDVQVTSRNIHTGRQRSTYTSGDGSYRILGMRGGDFDDYIIRASKAGYVFRGSDSLRVDNLAITETRSGVDFAADAILIDISGRVVDSSGTVVPGVSVTAWSESVQIRDTTDVNGQFAIIDLYPNSRYSLSTELPRESYDNATVSFDVALRDTTGITLTIGRHNAVITGLVSNAEGAPIANAAVTMDEVNQVTTNNSGIYRFDYVLPGRHSLTFTKRGFINLEAIVDAGNGEGEYTQNAVLTALDRAIFGSIVDATNSQVVSGVVVGLVSNSADTLWDTTYANGVFQFNDLDPLKTYSLRTAKKGYGVYTRSGMSIAEGNIEVSGTVSLPARGVFGSLTDANGMTIAQAVIKVRSFNNQVVYDTTNFFGDYYAIVEPGTYAVIGYNVPPALGNSRSINVAVEADRGSKQNLTIEPTGRLEGRLQLEDGTPPLTSSRISASHNATGDLYLTVAGNDGSFILEGLRSGSYTISAIASGYAMQISPFYFDARLGEITSVTILMTRSGKAIFGNVLDEDGIGVQRARVTLSGNSPGYFETDGKGYWSQPGPLAGRYVVSVVRNGYAQPADTTFDLEAGGLSQIDRTISPLPMTISGRLLGVNGNPFANGMIYLLTDNVARDSVATDIYGEYSFNSLSAARYDIQARVPGYTGIPSTQSVDLTISNFGLNKDFTLTAVRGFGIVHGVIRHDGDPVEAQVTIVDVLNGSRLGVTSGQDGSYRITKIPTPSTFRLNATYPDVPELSSGSFLLQTDEDQTHDLTFPAGQIHVTLLNADGNPIVGRRVFVTSLDFNYSSILYSDGLGTASTVDWLPSGIYSVVPEAISGMLPPSPKIVDLPDNGTINLPWFLGWRFTPPPPFSFEDSARVQIAVPASVSITDADLYFKGPGASGYSSTPLQREAGGRTSGRSVRSVAGDLPVISGMDETVTYFGYIPSQGRSGTLSYYLQVVTSDGFIFGGIESAQDVTISARGLLDRIEITRTQSALLPRVGVPFRITISAFDDGNNNLTQRLREEGRFEWVEVGESLGRLEIDALDSSLATYYPENVGRAEIVSRVTQPSAGVTISNSLQWDNATAVITSLNIASSQYILKAGDSLRFTATALDTSGALVPVDPIWKTSPIELATAIPVPYSMDAWLKTNNGIIGKVQITAEDTLSEISANFNDDSPDRSQHGLAIFSELRSGGTDTTILSNGRNFEIKIPANAFTTNATARVFLNEPNLSPVFRLTTKYELASVGYNVTVEGNLSLNAQYFLTLPVPPEFKLNTPTVGVWNSQNIDWDVITGQFNSDSTKVHIEVASLSGLYALISASEALGVRDIRFLPNPFSPQATTPGLSIEFRLTSDMSDQPNLSVMIYNMQGQLVRKLIDSRQMPKGDYRRGGENKLIWDGLTDDNLPARNGRYIVVLIARDASGESKEVGSAVLVK